VALSAAGDVYVGTSPQGRLPKYSPQEGHDDWRETEDNEPRAPREIFPVRNYVGSGRVTIITAVILSIETPPAESMTSAYRKLPVNWKELVGRWSGPSPVISRYR